MVIKKNHLLFLILLFSFFVVKAQNLVPNGNFETFTSCPFSFSQTALAAPWTQASNHTGTSDYFNSCTASIGVNTPNNSFGYQQAHSGVGYVGLINYAAPPTTPPVASSREYISVQLSSPMVSGFIYSVGFYVSLANNCQMAADGFGAYISTGPAIGTGNNFVLPYIPQISNPAGNVLLDTLGWTLISGTYTASGGENYITIGNFQNNANTSLVLFNPSLGAISAYYFVDDVYVIPPLQILGNDICQGDSVTLTAINDSVFAWVEGLAPNIVLSNSSTLTVSPNVTTTYILYGSSDTVSFTVNVNSSTFPTSFNLGNDTTLCVGDSLLLDIPLVVNSYLWQDGSMNPTYMVTQPGTYWLEAVLNNCIATDSIEVNYTPIPNVDLGNDTTLCAGSSLSLDVTNSGSTYLWQDGSTNSSYVITQAGTYIVSVTSNTCSVSDTIVVNYAPLMNVNLGNDTSFCPGDFIVLDATNSNATYLWQDNSTSPTLTVNQQGMYWVTVTSGNCSESDTIQLNLYPIPIVNLGNDTTLCQGALVVLNAFYPNATYLWQDNSLGSDFTVSQAGIFWSQVISADGCTNADTIQVDYIAPILVNLGSDLSFCQGQTVVLDATNANTTYLWQDGSTASQFQITQSGQYFVEVSNECESVSDTLNVSYFNPPANYLGNDTTLCEGEILTLNVNILGTQTLWQDQSISNMYSVSQPGTYTALTSTTEGCTTTDEIVIDYIYFPEVDLGPDRFLCEDEVIEIRNIIVNQGVYFWSNGSSENEILVNSAGVYSVQLSNECGVVRDTVVVLERECDCKVYIPNSFTPNDDEFNGLFGAYYDCNFIKFQFTIYNRWGEIIWESNDPDVHWDGSFQNKKVNDGTYIYKVKYSSEFVKEEVLIGHFSVFR